MLMPTTPLPDFVRIIKSFLFDRNNAVDVSFFTKQKKHSRFYSRGSDAIASLSMKIVGTNSVVFVPAYFCNESLGPLRNSQAKIVFYSINIDLTPDWEHIHELSKSCSPDVFILTHYFGEVNDVAGAVDFVNANNTVLLHDCAHHSFIPEEISSSQGMVMLSPHKIFAISPLSILACDEVDSRYLSTSECCNFKKQDFVWMAKRFIQKYFSMLLPCRLKKELPGLSGEDVIVEWGEQKVSRLSLVFFSAILRDVDKDISIRSENYQRMFKCIHRSIDNNLIQIVSNEGIVAPYLFVLYVDESLYEKIYIYLRMNCIPVNTWPDLPPEVVAEPILFQHAIYHTKTLLFFPVHQSINKNQIDFMCSTLLKGVEEL